MDVRSNLAEVRARIDAACRTVGRDPGEVRLLPVSKTHGLDLVRQAYDAGYRRLGENRVQEALAKWEASQDWPGMEWAIIGHLQTNKARDVARFAAEFQALDSLRLARELDRRLQAEGRALDVLIEVNSSGEPQKSGVAPEDAAALAAELRAYDALRVRGLMTVAVHSPVAARVGACFEAMRTLQERLRQDDRAAGSYDELSMGMSGDFELAIAHGATCVRVGRAIFGERASR
ncbi:YggS family pyridoxal phosphate-dependent enzyme [Raineyella sp. LH-20]|uniref:YggS family pyridoxal phosphate-dependent enzyme n=1 Tax=Raineyella sp. LH-20 TaxID=3081204 RepID=UPI002953C5AF|nr:YggS family pyridoxal phosphate-dependent enzyme [Raineyella sp. LH-20]WOP20253.1 YggS family pyridoxal phosphate-dependent enzyme [Raineyella sp. LH-20]